ncbi:MAG: sigma-70 family RNA polymerase sigma factor [Pirellulales bacterium]
MMPDSLLPTNSVRTQWLLQYEAWLRLLARMEIGHRFQGKFDHSDAVQQTLIAAWRDWDGFRGSQEGERVAWLRQILAHQLAQLARQYGQTQKRDVERELSIDQSLCQSAMRLDRILQAEGPSPSQAAIQVEQRIQLSQAIENLPEDYRQVILLRNFEELSHEEVAVRMQRTEGAVRMLWLRALTALRDAMQGSSQERSSR